MSCGQYSDRVQVCRDLSLAMSLSQNKIYWPAKKVSNMVQKQNQTKQQTLLNRVQLLAVLPNNNMSQVSNFLSQATVPSSTE